MDCKNSAEAGCLCWQHAAGLSKHAPDQARYLTFLEACRPTRVQLSVLTMDEPVPLLVEPCSGGYLCDCTECDTERAARKPSDPRQPWQAKAA